MTPYFLNNRLGLTLYCVGFLCIQRISAQTFDRVEMVSGFANLENNNGVAVADYDGDFDLDVFVVAKAIEEEGDERSSVDCSEMIIMGNSQM
ncbi:MAG: hypothetical protein HRU26_05345 [Psychroserpens sp.]|nr:hypothetical protein [Psychroserpens sp.]